MRFAVGFTRHSYDDERTRPLTIADILSDETGMAIVGEVGRVRTHGTL